MAEFKPKKNKYVLSGKNGKIALKLLNDVTDVLDKYDVKYWLDFGTLLGIVRENRILPWDDDIDISIFESDIEIMKTKVMPEIKKLRYRGYIRDFSDSVAPLKAGNLRSFKVRNNRLFFLRGYVKLDIFVLYNIDKKLYWVEHGEPHSSPEELLVEFDTIKFNGKDYRIPKDYDKYLTYHYGDWRTPNKDYNSSIDNVRTLDN
jgi:phosphorylcholine metabolism protein LicD